jgi:hypothetical protein
VAESVWLVTVTFHNCYLISFAAGQPVVDMTDLKQLIEGISKLEITSPPLTDKNGHSLPLLPLHPASNSNQQQRQ